MGLSLGFSGTPTPPTPPVAGCIPIGAAALDMVMPSARYSLLVKTDRPIEIEARSVHHIGPEDLRKAKSGQIAT